MSHPESEHRFGEGQPRQEEPSSPKSHIDFSSEVTRPRADLGESFSSSGKNATPPESQTQNVELPTSAARTDLADHEILLQASQIAEHQRNQYAELDRREQSLNEQLSRLDQEQRQQRFREQDFENKILSREEELKRREVEFGSRVEACQTLVDDLERQEKTLDDSRQELEAKKAHLREDLQKELVEEKRTLCQLQNEYEQKNEQLQLRIQQIEAERIDALKKIDQQLEDERAKLHEDLLSELETERASVKKEREDWDRQYAIQKQALEEATTKRESDQTESLKLVKKQRIEWEAQKERDRDKLNTELQMVEKAVEKAEEQIESQRTELEKEYRQKLGGIEQSLKDERSRQIEELTRQQAQQQIAFEQEQSAFRKQAEIEKAALENQREEMEREKTRQIVEWERQFDEQMTKAKTEKEFFEREMALEKEKLAKEKTVLGNRIKFQQDHLEKSQHEFEAARHEFEQLVQTRQAEFQKQELLLHYRSTQLDHYRALSDERFGSLEREHRLLNSARKTMESDALRENEHFELQKKAWEKERAVQQAELQRQQNMLDQHADNLERRKERLDQLRSELEETHRETLEMRMAVEEAMAQLAQSTDEGEAKKRIENAKAALSEHYKLLRESVVQQREALQETKNLHLAQRDELEEEKQSFAEWFAEREEQLKQWESRLVKNMGELDEKISSYREMRDTVFSERVEAESIIRELLDQLEQVNQTASDVGNIEESPTETTESIAESSVHAPHSNGPHFSRVSKQKMPAIDENTSSAS